LAAEIARSEGFVVEMVIVADDVAIPDAGDMRRGMAGTVFVHKIAGAVACRQRPLAEVAAAARTAAAAIGTMGVALGAAIVPGAGTSGFSLGADEIELGLGIHGEPGIARTTMTGARELTGRLLAAIVADREIAAGDRVVLLVNDFGGTPPMELDIVSAMAIEYLTERRIVVERLWAGRFLTSLEMPGVSLTLLTVDDDRLALLDAPVGAGAWPSPSRHGVRTDAGKIAAALAPRERTAVRTRRRLPSAQLRNALAAIAQAIGDAQYVLTELDQNVGDGDLGISLARAADAIRGNDAISASDDPADVLAAIAADLRRVVGGTSGPLYAAFVLRGAHVLAGAERLDAAAWSRAFIAGCDALRALGGASVGDCTMLDALQPAADTFARELAQNVEPVAAFAAAAVAAHEGAAATVTMLPMRGRARYLGERARTHVDPGAVAVTIWLDAVATAIGPTPAPAHGA
jgi:dihydroxyacetone kinase